MVAAVVEATPEDWSLAGVMDWSGGFWEKMREEYPRVMIFQVNDIGQLHTCLSLQFGGLGRIGGIEWMGDGY